jgi:hypothetical protein
MKSKHKTKRQKAIAEHKPPPLEPLVLDKDRPNHCSENGSNDKDNATEQKDATMPFGKQYFTSVTITDSLVAICTVIIAVATVYYTHYAGKTISDNKEALEISNRAYVCVKNSTIFQTEPIGNNQAKIIGSNKLQLKAGDIPAIEVMLANFGNTPANSPWLKS